MHPQRKLTLRVERLAELDPADLRAVAGGTHIHSDCYCTDTCPPPTYNCSLEITDCLRRLLEGEDQTGPCG